MGTRNAKRAYRYAREGNPVMARVVGGRKTFSDELSATNFKIGWVNDISYGAAYTIDGIELTLSLYFIGRDFKVIQRTKSLINFLKNTSKNNTYGKVVNRLTTLPKNAVTVCSSIRLSYKNSNTVSRYLYRRASTNVISYINRLQNKVNRNIQTRKHTLQTFGTAWSQFKVDLNPRVALQLANIPGEQYNIFDRQKVIKDATYNFINNINNIGKNLDNVDGVLDGSKLVNALDDMDNVNLGRVGKGGLKSNLLEELANSGVKYNPDDIVAITKTADGKLVWLENGTESAGLNHIIGEHADDFLNKGMSKEDIPNYIMQALENGKIIGYQGRGTGRPIYEFIYKGEVQSVAITVGNNGFIVGANPK